MYHFIIISPLQMNYISKLFQNCFQKLGHSSEIKNSFYKIKKKLPHNHFYFIYCLFSLENIFDLPRKQYIIYQLEQHTNNQLNLYYNSFEMNSLKNLYENSVLSFDYCEQNINVLQNKLNITPFLLPIPFSQKNNYWEYYKHKEKVYDIVFIGLLNKRRCKILNYLKDFFKIGIPKKKIFGNDLVHFVSKGKLLLNIHFYENAILERVRLNEMIAIGIPIISEKPNEKDLDICKDYDQIITFIDIIEKPSLSLVQNIKNHLKDYNYDKINILEEKFNNSFNKFFNEF